MELFTAMNKAGCDLQTILRPRLLYRTTQAERRVEVARNGKQAESCFCLTRTFSRAFVVVVVVVIAIVVVAVAVGAAALAASCSLRQQPPTPPPPSARTSLISFQFASALAAFGKPQLHPSKARLIGIDFCHLFVRLASSLCRRQVAPRRKSSH